MIRLNLIKVMVVFVFFIPTSLSLPGQETSEETSQDSSEETVYSDQLVNLLEEFQQILANDKKGTGSMAESWQILTSAINQGVMRFSVSPNRDILINGAKFVADIDYNTAYILISRGLLDSWKRNPATAYAELGRVVTEASRFFPDPMSWFASRKNPLDNFYILIDGYRAEAEFIQNYLIPEGIALSPYETYILGSYLKDGVNSISLLFGKFSFPVVEKLDKARWDFETNGDSGILRNYINSIGKDLLKTRNALVRDPADLELYPIAIAVHTWLETTPEILSRIYNKNSKDALNFIEVLEKEPEYTSIRNELEASRIKDMPVMEHVYNENLKGFEEKISTLNPDS